MPFELPLPARWAAQGWRAKIREREGPEEPHVTILHGTLGWRFSLREWRCLDADPPARLVPEAVLEHVRAHVPILVAAWDAKYPSNLVRTPNATALEQAKRRKRKKLT